MNFCEDCVHYSGSFAQECHHPKFSSREPVCGEFKANSCSEVRATRCNGVDYFSRATEPRRFKNRFGLNLFIAFLIGGCVFGMKSCVDQERGPVTSQRP